MVSKTSAVRSIRLPNQVWAQLAQEVERRGGSVTVNSLIHDLVIVGLLKAAERRATPDPKPVAVRAVAAPKPAFKSRLKGEWKAP
jgi:hypothetical protein